MTKCCNDEGMDRMIFKRQLTPGSREKTMLSARDSGDLCLVASLVWTAASMLKTGLLSKLPNSEVVQAIDSCPKLHNQVMEKDFYGHPFPTEVFGQPSRKGRKELEKDGCSIVMAQ